MRQDGTNEVIDGQQRTISVAQYVNGDYSLDGRYIHNLQDDEQERILNYSMPVYICEGNASEKLDWFRIINIAGVKLTDQVIALDQVIHDLGDASLSPRFLSGGLFLYKDNMARSQLFVMDQSQNYL